MNENRAFFLVVLVVLLALAAQNHLIYDSINENHKEAIERFNDLNDKVKILTLKKK